MEWRWRPNRSIGTYRSKNAKLKAVAAALAADYKEMFGKELTIVNGATKGGDVVLSLKKDKALGDEGYTMNVGSAVEITAATERGAFWATRTLLQIAEQHKMVICQR